MTILTRRQLLSLCALAPALGVARRAAAATTPKFIFFHTPNGFHREAFGSDGNGASFNLRPSLVPLEPWKSRVSAVMGLCNKSTDAMVGYTQLCRLLTCTRGPDKQQAYSASLDQFIASKRGSQALNLFALADSSHLPVCPVSWKAANVAAANVHDNAAVWNALFTNASLAGPAADRQQLIQSFLNQAFARTYGPLPRLDKERIDAHIAALAELNKRQGAACGVVPPFGLDKAAAPPGIVNAENLQKNGRAKIDMLVAGLVCGAPHAATLAWQQPGPGGLNPTNNVANHFELSLKTDAASVAERSKIDAWYASQFAYLLDRLDAMDQLDQTIVVWGSEVAEGQHHNNMTFIVAGGQALGVKPQVTIVVPFEGDETAGRPTAELPSNRPVADLWLTVLSCLGVPQTSFGDTAAAPLLGLLQ